MFSSGGSCDAPAVAVPGRSHTHVHTPLRETRGSEGGGLGHLGQQRDGVCSLGRHGENISAVFKGGYRDNGARLLTKVHGKRTRVNGHKP